METMKMGILGSGGIAHTMANTVKEMKDVELYAVGSRTLENAEKFAAEFGISKAYGSYEELAADPEVDLVYVATPHSHHYPHVKLLLEHGKHVLCEKAFTVNANQARELFQMAEEKSVVCGTGGAGIAASGSGYFGRDPIKGSIPIQSRRQFWRLLFLLGSEGSEKCGKIKLNLIIPVWEGIGDEIQYSGKGRQRLDAFC